MVQAKPRSAVESLTFEAHEQLNQMLRQLPLAPPLTSDYQLLLEEQGKDDEERENEDGVEPGDPAA